MVIPPQVMYFIILTYILLVASFNFQPNTKFNITCISLERSQERKRHIESILSFAKCNYDFFNAVDGNHIITKGKDISEFSRGMDISNYVNRHLDLDRKFHGAAGLKFSSYILLRELEKSSSPKPLLILEDDADLDATFVPEVENMLDKMRDEWDIIILSPSYRIDPSRPYNEETGLTGIKFFTGTYAYLVNGSLKAKKLADFLENCPTNMPIDVLFRAKTLTNEIIGYAFAEPLATHLGDVFHSNIPTSCFVGPVELKNSLYKMAKDQNDRIAN